jgi:hypothetical protein
MVDTHTIPHGRYGFSTEIYGTTRGEVEREIALCRIMHPGVVFGPNVLRVNGRWGVIGVNLTED